MKILLISGHGAGDSGAVSSYGVEATETIKLAHEIKIQLNKYNCEVILYDINRNAFNDVKNGCFKVDLKDIDYVFELHLNAFTNSKAYGTEIYVTRAEKGITVEEGIVNKLSKYFYNRGVKRADFAVINYAKKKGISSALLETCFISNKNDMLEYEDNFIPICKSIAEGIAEGFKLEKKEVKVIKRLIVDNKQVGAYSEDKNILKEIEKHLKVAKNIEIEVI